MNEPTPVPVLQAQQLGKTYTDGALSVQVLSDVDVQVLPGQTLAVVGASGSGKSTLLHILGGLDAPSTGQACVWGRSWAAASATEQGTLRNRHLGFVYQFHHLLPELTAQENVAMPLMIRRMPRVQALAQAADWLGQVGLGHRLLHRPAQLSGGERQRVAIARALVTQPDCVLADEPTGNLDRGTADAVFDLLLSLAQARGMALVVVTHDAALAQRCSRRLHLAAGRLVPV